MKRSLVVFASALAIAVGLFGCAGMDGQGWTTLIDGEKGLENFNRIGEANWRAEGGAIVADKGKGGYLVSKNSYKDFVIYAEFWADHTTNSGIHIRMSDPKKATASNSYEVNIFDQRPAGPGQATGGIPNFASVSSPQKAGGKWNTYEIYAKGREITVKFNGIVTVSIQDGTFTSGPIALQFGNRGKQPGGAIKWRKVEIRSL